MKLILKAFLILLSVTYLWEVTNAYAPPEYFIVRGKLINQDLSPKQGIYQIRVSLWLDADANDKNPNNINDTLWFTNFPEVTLESDGRFEVLVGKEKSLPSPFSFETFQYLQLETRKKGETKIHLLDPIPTNSKVDRINLLTIPFKSAPEHINGRTIGYGPGEIPYLDEKGELPVSVLPSVLKTMLTSLQTQIRQIQSHIDNSPWELPVDNKRQLPGRIDSKTGEVRYVVDEKQLHLFDGDEWAPITAGGEGKNTIKKTSYTLDEIIDIHFDQTATPGLFYWDHENKEYYVGTGEKTLKPLFGGNKFPKNHPPKNKSSKWKKKRARYREWYRYRDWNWNENDDD